jgi:hypothetical protein
VLDYGYAANVHKAQGVTLDQAHVLALSHFARHLGYVAINKPDDNGCSGLRPELLENSSAPRRDQTSASTSLFKPTWN